MTVTHSASDAASAEPPTYSYKANLAGSPWTFRLSQDGIDWSIGMRSGLMRYDRISRVRLSYRPATMQMHRFLAEIWSPDVGKIQIASTTWQGLALQQRADAPYRAFITELHRRLAAAGSKARFQCGTPTVLYGLGLVFVSATMLAFFVLLIRAAQVNDWRTSAVIAGIFAVCAWQLGTFFFRNRPEAYRPDAIPDRVLPRG